MENLDETAVQKFYNGKSIFMTGGTGFLGKIIMEKLLRTCQVDTIYLLIRDKKGKDIHTRVEDLFDDVLYDRVRQQNPKFRHKIHPIAGDCALPGLGITPHDRQVLCKAVHVVFHVAATVRFDEKLRIAMGINVRGTREVLELCRGIEHLAAAVHVSTAYANCNRPDIDEKFYKYPISAAEAIKTYEGLDDEALERIGSEHSKAWPNTYTYTKALAEDLINTEAKGLPVAIVRPAIVLHSAEDPLPGWSNNLYGPTGLMVGVAMGIIHVCYVHKDNKAELVPVDMCVNAMLVCAKDRATREHKEIPIVNFVTAPENKVVWQHYLDYGFEHGLKIPLMRSIWYNNALTATNSWTIFGFLWFLYHTLPAFFVDICFLLVGMRPKMMKVYRKIKKISNAILYFTYTKFTFTSDNLDVLWDSLSPRDRELFNFDLRKIDWNAYMQSGLLGMRLYLMKDPLSTLPEAHKRQQRFKIIHYSLIYTLYAVLGIFLAHFLMKLLLPSA